MILHSRNDETWSLGSDAQLLSELREATFLVLEAANSEAMMAQQYFSLEFKAAVYLPVLIPAALPLIGVFQKME